MSAHDAALSFKNDIASRLDYFLRVIDDKSIRLEISTRRGTDLAKATSNALDKLFSAGLRPTLNHEAYEVLSALDAAYKAFMASHAGNFYEEVLATEIRGRA